MVYFAQTDRRWKSDVMTAGTDALGKTWIDKIGRWGCLVVSLCNAYNRLLDIETDRNHKPINPKKLNELIIQNNGYNFLRDPLNVLEDQASLLLWDVVDHMLNIRSEHKTNFDGYGQYIAQVKHPVTGGSHFVNIILQDGDQYIVYDVDSDTVYTLLSTEIKEIKKITYRG